MFIRTVSFTQIIITLISFMDTPNSVFSVLSTVPFFKMKIVTNCLIRAYLFGSSGDAASSVFVCVWEYTCNHDTASHLLCVAYSCLTLALTELTVIRTDMLH
jgi:hypothetical protein